MNLGLFGWPRLPPSEGGGVTPSALSKSDDTNVTLTLGGSPLTALLQAVSLTLGWTGLLAVSRGGTGAGTGREAAFSLGVPYILGRSAVAAAHTGNTSETILATITVPANAMGANGRIRIRTTWSMTNNANNKTFRVRFNGIGGTAFSEFTRASILNHTVEAGWANRNATNSQIGDVTAESTTGLGSGTVAVPTAAIDTTAARDIVITGQLANAGDTVTLESYEVTLIP